MRTRSCLVVGAVALSLAGCTQAPGPVTRVTVQASASAPASPTASSGETPEPDPSPTASGWDAVFDAHGDAVVRVSALSCDDGAWMGTAFAVGDDLLVTAAHVAEDARALSVQTPDGDTVPAEVVGLSRRHDVAVLRTDDPVDVEPLTLADEVPGRGSPLAVLGYPLGTYDLRIVQGIVAGLPEPVEYENQSVDRAFITDAAVNGGNSGGPVLDSSGQVIGLVSGVTQWDQNGDPVEDTSLVIPVEDVAADLARMRGASPRRVSCPGEVDVAVPDTGLRDWDGELRLSVEDPSDTAQAVGQVLYTHGLAIDHGAYSAAFELFTAAQQRRLGGLETWSEGVTESFWADVDVLSVTESGGTARATVALRTFDGFEAPDCHLWRLRYDLRSTGEGWLIERASGSRTACSE